MNATVRRPVIGLLLCVTAGCVTAEGELRPDGSLHLTARYVPGRHARIAPERARFMGEGVVVESLVPDDRFTVVDLTAGTVAQLTAVPALSGATVTRRREGELERLEIRVAPPDARQLAYLEWARGKQPDADTLALTITLPGTAVGVDANGVVDDGTVRWRVPLATWQRGDEIALWVRWRPSAAVRQSM